MWVSNRKRGILSYQITCSRYCIYILIVAVIFSSAKNGRICIHEESWPLFTLSKRWVSNCMHPMSQAQKLLDHKTCVHSLGKQVCVATLYLLIKPTNSQICSEDCKPILSQSHSLLSAVSSLKTTHHDIVQILGCSTASVLPWWTAEMLAMVVPPQDMGLAGKQFKVWWIGEHQRPRVPLLSFINCCCNGHKDTCFQRYKQH